MMKRHKTSDARQNERQLSFALFAQDSNIRGWERRVKTAIRRYQENIKKKKRYTPKYER